MSSETQTTNPRDAPARLIRAAASSTEPPTLSDPPLNERPRDGDDEATSNATMATKILSMPVQPYRDGGYVVRVLEVRGRRTGIRRQVPIAVIQLDGARFLVSPRADRSWARNLAADGRCALTSGEGCETYRASPAEPAIAVQVLRTYVAQLRWASAQFPFPDGASPDLIREHLDQVAVFHLEPAAPEGSL
jgi:hypothetical protein